MSIRHPHAGLGPQLTVAATSALMAIVVVQLRNPCLIRLAPHPGAARCGHADMRVRRMNRPLYLTKRAPSVRSDTPIRAPTVALDDGVCRPAPWRCGSGHRPGPRFGARSLQRSRQEPNRRVNPMNRIKSIIATALLIAGPVAFVAIETAGKYHP